VPLPGLPTLSDYIEQTRNLLNDSDAAFYSDANLTEWINIARVQVSADGECLRQQATIPTVAGLRTYQWSTATFDTGPLDPAGLSGIFAVRWIGRRVGDGPGQVALFGEAWEWLNAYYLQHPAPIPGIPTRWAPLQSGATGAFVVDPTPDDVYTLVLDPVCYPVNLVLGASPPTKDVLPSLWTHAVPYYAAYLALEKAQRTSDANGMFAQYRLFARRATQMTTPTLMPAHWPGGQGAQTAQQKSLIGGPAEQAPRG
jgi:hypothetical protein